LSLLSIAADHLNLHGEDVSLLPSGKGQDLRAHPHRPGRIHNLERAVMSSAAVTSDRIIQIALQFMASKTLLSAVELGLFTLLAREGPLTSAQIGERLELHPRGISDFLDTLVALDMLERCSAASPTYRNTPATGEFLDRAGPSYIGGLLEMSNSRLYPFWGHLTEALKTGKPQNEVRDGRDLFGELYADPDRLRQFLEAMTGISAGAARAIAEKFDWTGRKTFADIGCAQGMVPATLARTHTHLTGLGFDLPQVRPIFEEYIASLGLADRVRFQAGDFTKQPLPRVDVLIMGHILHDWNLQEKKALLARAYEALEPGGALIVYEALIDDDRRTNTMGLLMSLNMLIETPGGFDYTGADCRGWMAEAGFSRSFVEHLCGPDSMVVGIK
jgi:SAM-dependent methyltransferase